MKALSRQLRWQHKHRALGLCVRCSRPADSKAGLCAQHYLTQLDSVERYEAKKGTGASTRPYRRA